MSNTDLYPVLEPVSLLNHMISGEIKKGKSFGVHYFDDTVHRVALLTKPPNDRGIWEAKIEIRNPKTNAWVVKKEASTFFPLAWCRATLLSKIQEAYRNSFRVCSFKIMGITSCGVRIIFITEGMKISTCFPEY